MVICSICRKHIERGEWEHHAVKCYEAHKNKAVIEEIELPDTLEEEIKHRRQRKKTESK